MKEGYSAIIVMPTGKLMEHLARGVLPTGDIVNKALNLPPVPQGVTEAERSRLPKAKAPTKKAEPKKVAPVAKKPEKRSGTQTRNLSGNEVTILRALQHYPRGASAHALKASVLSRMSSRFKQNGASSTWLYNINHLIRRRLIRKEGERSKTKYFLVENAPMKSLLATIKREARARRLPRGRALLQV